MNVQSKPSLVQNSRAQSACDNFFQLPSRIRTRPKPGTESNCTGTSATRRSENTTAALHFLPFHLDHGLTVLRVVGLCEYFSDGRCGQHFSEVVKDRGEQDRGCTCCFCRCIILSEKKCELLLPAENHNCLLNAMSQSLHRMNSERKFGFASIINLPELTGKQDFKITGDTFRD